jgi:multimeric flavodoxin WrbA
MIRNILAVTGSPRVNGYSSFLADEVIKKLRAGGNHAELISLRETKIQPCRACDSCRKEGSDFCVIDDDMKPLYRKVAQSSAILLASPVYWFSIAAQMKLFIDRLYGLNTEKSKILQDKKFGIILTYGDDDPVESGVINAIRSYEDMFRYTNSDLCGIIHKTEQPERTLNSALEKDIEKMAEALIS